MSGCSKPTVCLSAGALNRAEWIKFLGTFFNLDAEATAYFNGVVQAYNATKVNPVTSARQQPKAKPYQSYGRHDPGPDSPSHQYGEQLHGAGRACCCVVHMSAGPAFDPMVCEKQQHEWFSWDRNLSHRTLHGRLLCICRLRQQR